MKFKLFLPVLVLAFLLSSCSQDATLPETEPETVPEAAVQTVPPTQPQEESPTEPELVLAPDFTVYDIDGNEVRLSDFRGKPVVLNFWASWCGPCKMEMPDFNDKYLELQEDVHFLMVNLTDGTQETVEIASTFIAQQGYVFPVYYDTASEAAMLYGIRSIPTTFFIDAEGYGIARATGAIDAATLQTGIDMILPPEA